MSLLLDVVGDGTWALVKVGAHEVFALMWVVVGFRNEVGSMAMLFRC